MEVFEISFTSDIDIFLKKEGKNKRNCSIEFFQNLIDGNLKFFTIPPSIFFKEIDLSKKQLISLKFSPLLNSFSNPFIILGSHTQNSVLSFIIPALQEKALKNSKK